jgi:hypothetical protein
MSGLSGLWVVKGGVESSMIPGPWVGLARKRKKRKNLVHITEYTVTPYITQHTLLTT